MQRLTRILFVNWLACWLTLGLGLFGTWAPFWPAAAQSADGGEVSRVLEKHGSVRFRAPGETQWAQVAVGTELPPGSRVVTDGNGWVIIQHADGNFWVEPNARFVLPSPDLARVRQEVGNLHYRIIRMGQRRFEVETPYASLVVKGTVFDVRVTKAAMAVDVERGWVGIETREGTKADLRAGQAARISTGAEPKLEVRPAPGQAFVPAPPDRQITAAVQPVGVEPGDHDAGVADGEPGASKSWFERFIDTLQSWGGSGSSDGLGGGSGGDGSSSTSGSGTSGSGTSGSGTSGNSASSGSGTSGSGTSGSGTSGSGTSSASSGNSASSGSSSSSSPSGGGGLGVGVGVGGISAGVSVGGGGASVGVLGVGVGGHK